MSRLRRRRDGGDQPASSSDLTRENSNVGEPPSETDGLLGESGLPSGLAPLGRENSNMSRVEVLATSGAPTGDNARLQTSAQQPPQQAPQPQVSRELGALQAPPGIVAQGTPPAVHQLPQLAHVSVITDTANHRANNNPNQPQTPFIPAMNESNTRAAEHQRTLVANLRNTFHNPWMYWFHKPTQLLRTGYDIDTLPRRVPFVVANPDLDLRTVTAGYHLGIILRSVQTFKDHLIGLVKPFIRVHILSAETGFYLHTPPIKPHISPSIFFKDNTTKLNWNDDFTFHNLSYADIVTEDSIFLFEIIDQQTSLSLHNNNKNDTNKNSVIYKKVAWAYLLPIGIDGLLNVGLPPKPTADDLKQEKMKQSNHDVSLRLQLYHYRSYDGILGKIERETLHWPVLDPTYHSHEEENFSNIPSIYLQWKLASKDMIDGAFLKVSLGPRHIPKPVTHVEDDEGDYQDDDGSPVLDADNENKDNNKDKSFFGLLSSTLHGRRRRRIKSLPDRNHLRSTAINRTRKTRDLCTLPDRFLTRMEVGPEGAMVISFSHSGHLLAIVSRITNFLSDNVNTQDVVYSLQLYDSDLDEEIWSEETSHHGVIYAIQWSKNDRYLLTCSGDGSCKVWDLASLSPLMMHAYPHGQPPAHYTTTDQVQVSPRLGDSNEGLPNMLRPSKILRTHPPKCIANLTLPTAVYAYCGLFQELGNNNNNTTLTMPIAVMDMTTWQTNMSKMLASPVPRIIIGAADGRLRVFDDGVLCGHIVVQDSNASSGSDTESQDFSPHDGAIHCVAIDERTKYLITADSVGDILVWKLDARGWYQLLRKLRKDVTVPGNTAIKTDATTRNKFDEGSVLSLHIHPDKLKGLMLVLSRQPATLKVLSLTTYKLVHFCENFTGLPSYLVREDGHTFSAGVFHRAAFSADGRFILCCCATAAGEESNVSHYRLLAWDTESGNPIPYWPLSTLTFPYPIRSIAWHPSQHLIAVSMVGPGAAVVLYSTDRSSSLPSSSSMPASTDIYASINSNVGQSLTLPPGILQSQSSFQAQPSRSLNTNTNSDPLNYSLLDSSGFLNPPNNNRGNAESEGSPAAPLLGTFSAAMSTDEVQQPNREARASTTAARVRDLLTRARAARSSAENSTT